MQTKRLTLAADSATLFEFGRYEGNLATIKNETAGAVFFCDGPFDAEKAARIPAYSWQSFVVAIHFGFGETPKFYVKAEKAGVVEIDLGCDGMGMLSSVYDAAGMLPHDLTFVAGDGATLTATLVRQHGSTLDLDTPVSMTSGATVFSGDVIQFAATATEEGFHPVLTVGDIELELSDGAAAYKIAGDTVASVEAVEDEEE